MLKRLNRDVLLNGVNTVGNANITLGSMEKLLRDVLALTNPEERYKLRQMPLVFRIKDSTVRVVIEGKTRLQQYVVEDTIIENNSLTVVIVPEFEEIEGFNGNG